MAVFFSRTFTKPPPDKTQEEVQQEIDALTHTEFMARLMWYLELSGTYGVSPYYVGGTLTANGKMHRALCNRLARINGNVEHMNMIAASFKKRDEEMARDAADLASANATPTPPKMLWLDPESYKKLGTEMSITRCLLLSYPTSGCVPLRTVTPEEMKELAGQEL